MPSICNFDVSVIGMKQTTPTRLPEYDIRLHPSPASEPQTQTSSAMDPDKSTFIPSSDSKTNARTSTCQCYVPSTPNQQFRVMVTNTSNLDACVTLLVDGEW